MVIYRSNGRTKIGSDIRGVALEGIEGESVNLTNEVTTALHSCLPGLKLRSYEHISLLQASPSSHNQRNHDV